MHTLFVLAVKDGPIAPGTLLPLRIGRPQSVKAIELSREDGDNTIFVVGQNNHYEETHIKPSYLSTVGTLAKIEKVKGNISDGFEVYVRGISRFRVDNYSEGENDVIIAQGEEWNDVLDADEGTYSAMLQVLREVIINILSLSPVVSRQFQKVIEGIHDLSILSYLCMANFPLSPIEKQMLLETAGLKDRVLLLMEYLKKYKDGLDVQKEIREKYDQKLTKHQREVVLREQLKAIQDELGHLDLSVDKDDLKKKIEEAKMPPEISKIARAELARLQSMGPQNSESHLIRTYLELLISLPWENSDEKMDDSSLNLVHARKILDSDHYGLLKIKERVLQHLAVMKLRKSGKGQILLFIGPPGVGKTGLGQSIARALGRKFVRASLGGVRDDSEIRGHRRTYIGAMPGRIIQGIKRVGENNPVFMLDEIDKLGRSVQGDPAAALLEVLDPEQNSSFLDHYLDVPFDLSKVFFIATANSLEAIPGPLLDRMEVIDVSGYTTAEKLHIAKDHLIPKQLRSHGMTLDQLLVSDEAILRVINSYTREAGVRDLQRKFVDIFRTQAEKVLTDKECYPIMIEEDHLENILGPQRFIHEVAEKASPPGVATGLAWTPHGGEILFVEAGAMPGKGGLIITGQLGNVMKESAQIALSLVRSRLASRIPDLDFENKDIHLHVPAGAIPKDGPSAGITMLVTLASLLTKRNVDAKLAMTGELTLRGTVMPVGGIKEKLIAAHRAGIERVILPKRNEKDLKDVPEEVKNGLSFVFVETAVEVLSAALGFDVREDFFMHYLNDEGERTSFPA